MKALRPVTVLINRNWKIDESNRKTKEVNEMTIFMIQCLDQLSSERLPPTADWIRFRDQQQNLLG